MLRRVDAENRLQTLKEELQFQKNIYGEVRLSLLPYTLTLSLLFSLDLSLFTSLSFFTFPFFPL